MKQSGTIGIIGDGQLALMLAEALVRLKAPFLCFSLSSSSPMQTFFPDSLTSDQKRFQEECSVFTLENEFHTISELKELLGSKVDRLFPNLESYTFFADKISQRKFYQEAGIPSPRWLALTTETDLELLADFPFPLVLKTSQGGYDGKGVRVIANQEELTSALREFRFHEGHPLLVEEKVRIHKEVAQGFLRHHEGASTLLPLVETVQESGVCNLVKYPAEVETDIPAQIETILIKLMKTGLVGIFNFEFFIDQNNRVLINEGAPRTHNSQHLTMDASPYSQFDLLALYLTDPAPAPQKLSATAGVMVNILGQTQGAYGDLQLPDLSPLKVSSKLYGKKLSSPGRKMGHVNVIDNEGKADLLMVGKKILKEYKL